MMTPTLTTPASLASRCSDHVAAIRRVHALEGLTDVYARRHYDTAPADVLALATTTAGLIAALADAIPDADADTIRARAHRYRDELATTRHRLGAIDLMRGGMRGLDGASVPAMLAEAARLLADLSVVIPQDGRLRDTPPLSAPPPMFGVPAVSNGRAGLAILAAQAGQLARLAAQAELHWGPATAEVSAAPVSILEQVRATAEADRVARATADKPPMTATYSAPTLWGRILGRKPTEREIAAAVAVAGPDPLAIVT